MYQNCLQKYKFGHLACTRVPLKNEVWCQYCLHKIQDGIRQILFPPFMFNRVVNELGWEFLVLTGGGNLLWIHSNSSSTDGLDTSLGAIH